jgi:hypothetical protein
MIAFFNQRTGYVVPLTGQVKNFARVSLDHFVHNVIFGRRVVRTVLANRFGRTLNVSARASDRDEREGIGQGSLMDMLNLTKNGRLP